MAINKQSIIGSHFVDLVDHVDVELIAPIMKAAGILSAENESELQGKATRKQQVRFMINKVKLHSSGDQLFKECLEKSRHSQGHRKLLLLLYNETCWTGMDYKLACVIDSSAISSLPMLVLDQ